MITKIHSVVISCLDRLLQIIYIKKQYLLSCCSGDVSVFIKLALGYYSENRCFSKLEIMGILDPLGHMVVWKGCLHVTEAWGEGSDVWGWPSGASYIPNICACHYTATCRPGKFLRSPHYLDDFLVKINLDTVAKTSPSNFVNYFSLHDVIPVNLLGLR